MRPDQRVTTDTELIEGIDGMSINIFDGWNHVQSMNRGSAFSAMAVVTRYQKDHVGYLTLLAAYEELEVLLGGSPELALIARSMKMNSANVYDDMTAAGAD